MSMIEVDDLVKRHGAIEVLRGRDPGGRPGRGGRDHRAVGQRQEHVPPLPERAGDVPGAARVTIDGLRFDADDGPAERAQDPSARSAGGSAWSSRASTCSRTGPCCRT